MNFYESFGVMMSLLGMVKRVVRRCGEDRGPGVVRGSEGSNEGM